MLRSFLFAMSLVFLVAGAASAQVCSFCHNVHPSGPTGVHNGGVAACSVCHTMHNSQAGAPVDPEHPGGNEHLLTKSSSSDLCLVCHANLVSHVFGTNPLNPGRVVGAGDFVFLLEDNLNDAPDGASYPIPGHAAGHSVVVPSRGVGPDPVLTVSPGGSFPASDLGCTSCHDPHGNMNFRMLYGEGQTAQAGLFTYDNPAPDADGASIYHGYESNGTHTAYHSGVSAWCGNCHGGFHENLSAFIHATGMELGSDFAEVYNHYNGTDDPFGGAPEAAYLPLVPFDDPANTIHSRSGPSAGSEVMCLTCHRAHASSAPDAGRWDFGVTFLADDGLASGSYPIPNPYGANQRSLCNKCHLKDLGDGPR